MTYIIVYALICLMSALVGAWFARLDDGQRGLNTFLSAGCFVVFIISLSRLSVLLS